jgi:hypothetical protein
MAVNENEHTGTGYTLYLCNIMTMYRGCGGKAPKTPGGVSLLGYYI